MQYLVDIPKELFRIFSEKYGVGKSEKKDIDGTTYLLQRLTGETSAKTHLRILGDDAVTTIGLYQYGDKGSQQEISRFMVWNHVPQVCGVESLYVRAGIFGPGQSITENIFASIGTHTNSFNPIVPETVFIAEVLETMYRIGKDIKPRRYAWQSSDVGYVPEGEYRIFG